LKMPGFPARPGRKNAKARRYNGATESATENRPPAERSAVASHRETCETSSKRAGLKPGLYTLATFGKGEKVG
jgi:hypothetical protein